MPFDAANFRPGEWQSFASDWLPAASQQGTAHPEFIQQLSPLALESLTLEQLLRFWAHPVRAFSRCVCGSISGRKRVIFPMPNLSFLKGLSRYQLNQELLNTLVEQQDVEKLFRHYRAAGALPYGAFGEIIWEAQQLEMQELADRVIASASLVKAWRSIWRARACI
jgi:exodeoxyribonuclease V gamma subunit